MSFIAALIPLFMFFLMTAQNPSQSAGTATPASPNQKSQTPQTPLPTSDVCQNLKNPAHINLAKGLEGNDRILFCSIFDDSQRDQVLVYMKQSPSMTAQDAVIQVGKDNNLLFSSTPGGACGAH